MFISLSHLTLPYIVGITVQTFSATWLLQAEIHEYLESSLPQYTYIHIYNKPTYITK